MKSALLYTNSISHEPLPMQVSTEELPRTQLMEQLLSGLINTRSLRLNLQIDKDVRGIHHNSTIDIRINQI